MGPVITEKKLENLIDPSAPVDCRSTSNAWLKQKPPISAEFLNDGEPFEEFCNTNINDFIKNFNQTLTGKFANKKVLNC